MFNNPTENPLDPTLLAHFEESLGESLPTEYRRFLLEVSNGGVNDGALNRWEEGQALVFFVYGIDHPNKYLDLAKNLRAVGSDIVPGFLPFAEDKGGNRYCISSRDQDDGSIWFWDHELSGLYGDDPSPDSLIRIADSFESFRAGNYDPVSL